MRGGEITCQHLHCSILRAGEQTKDVVLSVLMLVSNFSTKETPLFSGILCIRSLWVEIKEQNKTKSPKQGVVQSPLLANAWAAPGQIRGEAILAWSTFLVRQIR